MQREYNPQETALALAAIAYVREHIKNLDAQARLNKEIKESSLDERLKNLRQATGDVSARRQLEVARRSGVRGPSRSCRCAACWSCWSTATRPSRR